MKINKRYIVQNMIIFIILFKFCVPLVCAEELDDNEYVINEQIQSEEVRELQNSLEKYYVSDIKSLFPDYDPGSIFKDAASGNFKLDLNSVFKRCMVFLFKEIYININIMIKLLILAVLCAILKNLQASFLSESVGELGFYVCYIVLVSVLVISFNTAMNLGREIIGTMVSFMHATIPVLITLLVSSGNVTSGGVFQPVLIMIVEIAATFFRNTFIPLVYFSAVLSIVNNISDKLNISRLAGLIKTASVWILGIILTVFIGVLSIHGTLGAVVDGVTGKTAKFAIGIIPVAGKYLADAAETVVSCALLIKNAAGLAVMIGIIIICLVPLLKMLALIVLYKLAGAFVEPISDERITKCISSMAGSLTLIMGVVASVAFMFFVSVTVIISAGNIATMIR